MTDVMKETGEYKASEIFIKQVNNMMDNFKEVLYLVEVDQHTDGCVFKEVPLLVLKESTRTLPLVS